LGGVNGAKKMTTVGGLKGRKQIKKKKRTQKGHTQKKKEARWGRG